MMSENFQIEFSVHIDEENAPHEYVCPISRQIMKNPVITMDGYTFERNAIEKWLRQNDKSPITGLKIERKFIENRALKEAINYHNQRENAANQNAHKLIQNTNNYIKSTLPEFINDIGLFDLDKLIAIAIQNIQLRKTLNQIKQQSKKFEFIQQKINVKLCDNCQRSKYINYRIQNIFKGADNILQSQPIIKNFNIEAKQFQYMPLSCHDLKLIDFKQLRKQHFKNKVFKSYGIQKLSINKIVQLIKKINKIPQTHFIQLWRTSMPTSQFFQHIIKSLQDNKCTYNKRIKQIGTKIPNQSLQLQQLNLKPDQYIIIEYGINDEAIFRGNQIRCQYCYQIKPQKIKCQCEKITYCSIQCANKDIQFHRKKCHKTKFIQI